MRGLNIKFMREPLRTRLKLTITIVLLLLFTTFLFDPIHDFLTNLVTKRIYNTTQKDCSFYANKPLVHHPIRCSKDFVFEHEAQYRAFLLGEKGQVFLNPKP